MYYFAKITQATGLALIGINFVINFPKLMNTKILSIGIMVFAFGWIIQHLLLKK